jgi:hypothetical protein
VSEARVCQPHLRPVSLVDADCASPALAWPTASRTWLFKGRAAEQADAADEAQGWNLEEATTRSPSSLSRASQLIRGVRRTQRGLGLR